MADNGGFMRKFAFLWALGLFAIIAAPAGARLWKPTPAELASDYTQIFHSRGDARVSIQWIPGAVGTGVLRQLLDEYVVISITHIMHPGGSPEWLDVDGVQVTDASGQPLKEIAPDAIDPFLVRFISAIQGTLRQGTQGRGKMKFLVFEPGPVQACAKGGLVVIYEGEHYTFDTPIPGCPAP